MCGIIGVHFKNPRDKGISDKNLEHLIDLMLLGIEHRGGDATGLLCVDKHGVPSLEKADLNAEKFIQWRGRIPKGVQTILGHTRLATQGSTANLDNNHPVEYEGVYAIHNGHIHNDSELFQKFDLARKAEVDSEIIPALFRHFGLNNPQAALEELDGGFATAVVDPANFPASLVLAKGHNSPLEVWENKYAIMWASVYSAIADSCEAVLNMAPSKDKVKLADEGDLILVNGGEVTTSSFTVKPRWKSSWKSSTPKGTTYSYGQGWTSYTPTRGSEDRDGDLFEECLSCVCKRLWHGAGADGNTGACTNRIPLATGGQWMCRCEGFMAQSRNSFFEWCDGCAREFHPDSLVKMGKYLLCKNFCARDLEDEGPTTEQLRASAEAVLDARMDAAIENDVSELDDECISAEMSAQMDEALKWASKKTGQTESFMEWLLFKAPADLFVNQYYLRQSRDIAREAFDEMYSRLSDEVAEIDSVRYATGDVILRKPSEITLDEETGVIVEVTEEVIA